MEICQGFDFDSATNLCRLYTRLEEGPGGGGGTTLVVAASAHAGVLSGCNEYDHPFWFPEMASEGRLSDGRIYDRDPLLGMEIAQTDGADSESGLDDGFAFDDQVDRYYDANNGLQTRSSDPSVTDVVACSKRRVGNKYCKSFGLNQSTQTCSLKYADLMESPVMGDHPGEEDCSGRGVAATMRLGEFDEAQGREPQLFTAR